MSRFGTQCGGADRRAGCRHQSPIADLAHALYQGIALRVHAAVDRGKMGCLLGERQFWPGLERRVHVRESGVHGRPMAAHQTPGIDHGPRAAPARWAAQGDSDMARCCSFRFNLFFQARQLFLALTAKRRRRGHVSPCTRTLIGSTNLKQETGQCIYRLQPISTQARHHKRRQPEFSAGPRNRHRTGTSGHHVCSTQLRGISVVALSSSIANMDVTSVSSMRAISFL